MALLSRVIGGFRGLLRKPRVMTAMGLLAGYMPARQASRVDPLVALRCE